MPFKIIQADLTKFTADAIVNAGNTSLKMGGGLSGAIFKAAGAEKLQAACAGLAPIKTGEAVITPGFDLPAKNIIHTAGPVYQPFNKGNSKSLLRAAYSNSLQTAVDNGCESIGLPLISAGIYGYPEAEVLQVASTVIAEFLRDHELDVTLVVFDKAAFEPGKELLDQVESYLDHHYTAPFESKYIQRLEQKGEALAEARELSAPAKTIDEIIGDLDEPFSDLLLDLIDSKGMTDVEVYKGANLDRKLFSKIRTQPGYRPSKRTVLSLAIALKLSLEETDELLKRAGFALSHAVKSDVIVEYFIINHRYDIYEINELLFEYDQPLLGA
jgi:O-acetyl-ADP-ribose deacetylase (regulator of RNase III)